MNKQFLKLLYYFTPMFFILCERTGGLMFQINHSGIKHVIVVFACACGLISLPKPKYTRFNWELKYILFASVFLYVVSIFFQLYNQSFKSYSLKEFYFLITPIIFIYCLFNLFSRKELERWMDAMFYFTSFIFVGKYVLMQSSDFTMSGFIQMFNWRNLILESVSPLGSESDTGVLMMIFDFYYIFKNDKRKIIIASLLTFFGYKRFVCLFMILFLIISPYISRGKKPKYYLVVSTIVLFLFLPSTVYIMCTDEFAFWFESKYDVDFNEFTMTRFYIVNMVIDANLTNYGLGTVTHYLEVLGNEGQTNMHNDILRIYMETTIIGSIVFTYCFFKIASKNIFSYFLMLFMFVELYLAHFLGPATIIFWIFVYYNIFYFNSELILKTPSRKKFLWWH